MSKVQNLSHLFCYQQRDTVNFDDFACLFFHKCSVIQDFFLAKIFHYTMKKLDLTFWLLLVTFYLLVANFYLLVISRNYLLIIPSFLLFLCAFRCNYAPYILKKFTMALLLWDVTSSKNIMLIIFFYLDCALWIKICSFTQIFCSFWYFCYWTLPFSCLYLFIYSLRHNTVIFRALLILCTFEIWISL